MPKRLDSCSIVIARPRKKLKEIIISNLQLILKIGLKKLTITSFKGLQDLIIADQIEKHMLVECK